MHEGHRQRMIARLEEHEDSLLDHELLEILLFNAIPRKNTNPIAHALLAKFGTVKGVFAADIDALLAVEGVGESAAFYLKCIGMCINAIYGDEQKTVRLKNYGEFRKFVVSRLHDKEEEVLEFYLCDKGGKVLNIYSHTDNEAHRVSIKSGELSSMLAASGAYGVIVAHNHLTDSSEPSAQDDKFTCEMQLICSMNGVKLLDHCVYGGDGSVFSYFNDGRIDAITKKYAFENVINVLGKLGDK